MGLDYGSRTVGVALSDELGLIASPYETVTREKEGKLRPTLRRILEICRDEGVDRIILGLPLNMDGSRGERAEKTEAFRELLRSRLLSEGMEPDIILWDERLSTVGAIEILEESGVPASERKTYVDKIAASLILEDYMKNGDKSNG
ncbi:MAG TPA: Holliday junction resolvase RuvX [Candidatus Avilachnospira avicola]|nr:Holliday junction resolvase RuvX [Candidatus Avilachnospira avicola]